MFRVVFIAWVLVACECRGDWRPADGNVAYSQTGQFIVRGKSLPPEAARVFRYDPNFGRLFGAGWTTGTKPEQPNGSQTNLTTVRLDPNYLVASAERVKAIFNEELNLSGEYRGKTYIKLLESAGPNSEITFIGDYDQSRGVWDCSISMPAELPADRLMGVLTDALIFEVTHRGAGPGGCDVPKWLVDGLIAHMNSRAAISAIFEPNRVVNTVESPVKEADQLNQSIGPGGCLTLQQLSWPAMLEHKPEVDRAFQLSAHALVVKLLALPDGGRCLGQTLLQLPRYQNWQFAFLNGFRGHFPSLLDTEKWWALASLRLSGKGAFEKWSLAESLRRLDAAIVLPVERHVSPDEDAVREEMDLSSIVNSLNFEAQKTLLARVISGLYGLELRAEPRLVRLVADYRSAVERYVTDRAEAIRVERESRMPVQRQSVVVDAALRRLNELAELRKDFELLLSARKPSTVGLGENLAGVRP